MRSNRKLPNNGSSNPRPRVLRRPNTSFEGSPVLDVVVRESYLEASAKIQRHRATSNIVSIKRYLSGAGSPASHIPGMGHVVELISSVLARLVERKLRATDRMALAMPRVNQMCYPSSFSACLVIVYLVIVSNAVSNIFWAFCIRFMTVGHDSFVGMANVPFVGVGREELVKFLGALMVSPQHLSLNEGVGKGQWGASEIYSQGFHPSIGV